MALRLIARRQATLWRIRRHIAAQLYVWRGVGQLEYVCVCVYVCVRGQGQRARPHIRDPLLQRTPACAAVGVPRAPGCERRRLTPSTWHTL